jgi:hypothetical protein
MRFLACLFLAGSILFAQTLNPDAAARPAKGKSSRSNMGSSGKAPNVPTPPSCGTKCGQERWPLKTLTDPEANIFKTAVATDTTVPALIAEPAPAKLTAVRAPLEKQLFHLKALLIGWKEELGSTAAGGATTGRSGGTSVPDHDFHIVIADPANTKTQMIIEVPDPTCQAVCSSQFLDKIKVARSAVSSQLGQPTASMVALPKPWLVEVTGPALFDFAHGQDGLAKNCIEIHPVLEIKFLQEQSHGPVHVNTKSDALPHQCGKK